MAQQEAELLAAVTGRCEDLGLLWHHSPDSRRDRPGFPDLVIAGTRGVLFTELKSDDGRRSLAQIKWAGRLAHAGLTYRLWRPADLKDGTIGAALEAIR
jgi:hypothetical protein